MSSTLHFVGLSGSLRKNSYNTSVLNACFSLLPEGVTLEIASIADIPLYNADKDIPAVIDRPATVKQLRETMAKADGFVIVSPEYNYSIPGVLKNAIDWASRGTDSPMLNKAVALMGATAGMWGTNKMQVAFHPVFQYLNMRSVYKPEILISQANKKIDANGVLVDEPTKELMKKQLQALKDLVLQLRAQV
jgi:chromate reductase